MNKQGALYILAAAVLWGTTGTAQALAPQGAQPLAVGTLRLIVGGLALLGMLAFSRKTTCPLPRCRLPVGPVLLAAVCMAAYQILFFAGVSRAGVAAGTVVGIGSSPVLAGALGFIFRGERPGWKWAVATLLAVAGCTLLVFAGQSARSSGPPVSVDPLGLLLAAGAGAAYATFSLVSKGLLERQPVERVMAVVFSLGAVLLAPLLGIQLLHGLDLGWLARPSGIGAVLHLGLLATALAYTLFGKGLRWVSVAPAVTLSLAEPLTAGLLGVLVLGERLNLPAGLGIALIFSGLAVLAFRISFSLPFPRDP